MICKACGSPFSKPRQKHLEFASKSGVCLDCVYRDFSRCMQIAYEYSPEVKFPEGKFGRTIGIEIECNPTIRSVYLAYLAGSKIIRDGSLRGRSVEIVSPLLREDTADHWIEAALGKMENNPNSRQGLHLWVGVQDMSWWDIYNIMMYCANHEDEFMSLVSPSRVGHGNVMGGQPVPIRDVFLNAPKVFKKRQFLKMLYGLEPEELTDGIPRRRGNRRLLWHDIIMPGLGGPKPKSLMASNKRCNCHGAGTVNYPGPITRYWWVNVHGYFHRRAIEIRLHHGVTSIEKVKMWKDLWVDLIPKMANHKNRSRGPLDLACPHLSEYYKARAEVYRSMREEIRTGAALDQSLKSKMHSRFSDFTRKKIVA